MRAFTCIGVLTILGISTTVSYAQTTSAADPLESMPFRFGLVGLSPTLSVTNFGFDDIDARHRDVELRAAQDVDDGDGFDVFDTVGDGNQGAHGTGPAAKGALA